VNAGVAADLHVFEALWHDFPLAYGVPESAEAWHLLTRFLDARLAR
jgi:acetyl esterase/lipase